MIKSLILTLLLLLSSVALVAQTAPLSELDTLKRRAAAALAIRNYAELIPTAVRLTELEKEGGNDESYETALRNLALWRRLRLIDLVKSSRATSTPGFNEDVLAAELNFRALADFANDYPDKLRLARAQVELAEFLDRFGRPFREIEELYLSALAIREKALPPDSGEVLSIVSALSDSYFYQAEYEKYYPLNRRHVAAVEKKFGPNDRRLVNALYSYYAFLIVTEQKAEADSLKTRLESMTDIEKLPPLRSQILTRSLFPVDVVFSKSPAETPAPGRIGGGYIFSSETVREGPGYSKQVLISHEMAVPKSQLPSNFRNTRRLNEVVTTLLIDEAGKVIDVSAESDNKKKGKMIKERCLKWRFKPLIVDGNALKLRLTFVAIVSEATKSK